MRASRLAKGVFIAAACGVVAAVAAGTVYVREQREFDPTPTLVEESRTRGGQPSASAIAVIGDSWVDHQRLDPYLEASLKEAGLGERTVLSFGERGAVSRAVYRNLLAPLADENSSAAVLEDPSIRYAVVVAGVNDTALHLGSDFYAHHVCAIARTLIQSGITPVLVEVPEYGIDHLDELRSTLGKLRARLYQFLFDGGELDVIARYRAALRERLGEEDLADRVVLVEGGRFVRDYEASMALYLNASHLNDAGSQMLAAVIVESILAVESTQAH